MINSVVSVSIVMDLLESLVLVRLVWPVGQFWRKVSQEVGGQWWSSSCSWAWVLYAAGGGWCGLDGAMSEETGLSAIRLQLRVVKYPKKWLDN